MLVRERGFMAVISTGDQIASDGITTGGKAMHGPHTTQNASNGPKKIETKEGAERALHGDERMTQNS